MLALDDRTTQLLNRVPFDEVAAIRKSSQDDGLDVCFIKPPEIPT